MTEILLEVDRGIAYLTLNRPERMNALTEAMMDDLANLCRTIEHGSDAHVVILTGTGRAFCSGGDIDAWSDQSAVKFARHWVRDGHDALDRLARLRQPVIAVLNGHAFGGGLELAACADLRIAETHIRIGQPEPGLGIIPAWSGTQRATRRFGVQLVRRMALFGEVISSDEALALGLVDRVVKTGSGKDAAIELAKKMRHRGPVATELTKMLINAAEGEETDRIYESLAGRVAAMQPELKTGLAAFKDRKTPDYWADIAPNDEET